MKIAQSGKTRVSVEAKKTFRRVLPGVRRGALRMRGSDSSSASILRKGPAGEPVWRSP
jgi:hypothetical protein